MFGKLPKFLWIVTLCGALQPPPLAADEAGTPAGRGPLRSRSQFPFALLFLGHAAEDPRSLARGAFELEADLAWSNTFVGNSGLRLRRAPGLAGEPLSESEFDAFVASHPEDAAFFLDGEVLRGAFRLSYGVHERVQVGAEVTLLRLGGDGLDGIIQNFHGNFGISDAGRGQYPHGSFQYALALEGGRAFQPAAEERFNVGDVTLGAKIRLVEDDRGLPAVALALAYKLPTGDPEDLAGSGHPDYGFNLLLARSVGSRARVYGNLGFVRAGDWALLPGLEIDDVYSALVGLEVLAGPRLSLVGQLHASSSPFRRSSGADLGGPSYETLAGLKVDLEPGLQLVFGVSENVISFDNSTDVASYFGLTWTF